MDVGTEGRISVEKKTTVISEEKKEGTRNKAKKE